jgi:L-aspartate oxidase
MMARRCDVADVLSPHPIVIGSGVAGLTAALGLGPCTVITKTELAEGSSRWAQGGIAAAVGDDDDPSLHAADTISVSGGLADPLVAELVSRAAPERIAWLQSLGAEFDHTGAGLSLGREAGHGRNRIIHANGDATGVELMRTLRAATLARDEIDVWEHTWAIDLLRSNDRVIGVLARLASGAVVALYAPAVILATGGIGRVYSRTTNPTEVTGDGLAMAARAGAELMDPEFVQFHPTALVSPLDPMPLLTEALRGAGAVLLDGDGHRYMPSIHDDAELAPRDIVARANWQQRIDGAEVFLDATLLGSSFPDRFPTVFGAAVDAGIDPRVEPMPVSPAAHYHMGGIAVDRVGRTSLDGLYAVGETAATGLHGANRLASNSLLEGLVFGARVAAEARTQPSVAQGATAIVVPESALEVAPQDDDAAVAELRETMWRHAGVVRTADGLAQARRAIATTSSTRLTGPAARNLATVASVVVETALARTESRGGHYRADFPAAHPAWRHHTRYRSSPEPTTTIASSRRVVA